ncbi:hypothetical protein Tco_0196502 [Tanacetum coccineum]
MLGAPGVQIPENNLDDLHSSREEYGTSETMDLQDLLGSFLLADIDLIILGLSVSLSRAVGFLRGTSTVVVILVKGHSFPTIAKVRSVGWAYTLLLSKYYLGIRLNLYLCLRYCLEGCDPLALVDGFTPL